jgi:ankyrin repeat protein
MMGGMADRELLDAARSGDLGAVSSILDHGANPDSPDEHGLTALAIATMFGHAEIASRLIDAGADPNARDESGSTVLMMASEFPRPDIVRMLVSVGADLNADATDGRTALLAAIWSEDSNAEVVKTLCDAGADTTVVDPKYGMTPLEWAERAGKRSVVRVLSEP